MMSDKQSRRRLVWLAATILTLAFGSLSASDWLAKGSKATGEKTCVIPDTEEMRRNHMAYLKHERHDAVRNGVTVTHSIAGCVNCHGGFDDTGNAIPVNGHAADGTPQFCEGCHEYVGVSLDCFQCHRKIPQEK